MTVDDILDYLWASKIHNFRVDLPNHEITMQLIHGETQYDLEIGGVIGFAWANSCFSGEDVRQNTDLWDYAELTSASLEDNCRVDVTSNDAVHGNNYYLNGYYFAPNLSFEIWSSVLLVEAKTIQVGDQLYTL